MVSRRAQRKTNLRFVYWWMGKPVGAFLTIAKPPKGCDNQRIFPFCVGYQINPLTFRAAVGSILPAAFGPVMTRACPPYAGPESIFGCYRYTEN